MFLCLEGHEQQGEMKRSGKQGSNSLQSIPAGVNQSKQRVICKIRGIRGALDYYVPEGRAKCIMINAIGSVQTAKEARQTAGLMESM